ncbi:MAG: IS1595 family transposase [Bryobacterales bacterium]|nr:IS1595 family transposase [Bryobacterales bacterium]MDE0623780.1 IS1595 family transposase [Bryobacterales bacterium]
MAKTKGPGKAFRSGISLKQFLRTYPNDEAAESWFIRNRWPNGVCCPHCGSANVQVGCKHAMPYRCREKACGRPRFSTKTGSVMEGSKLGYQDWIIAMFLLTTSLKSVSSMKLHRDLDITQKSAWFLAHRLRDALSQGDGASKLFGGPVEVDETYFGGKRKNMPKHKREELTGRGPVGKTAVVGAKDRETNQVSAKVVADTTADTLQSFVKDNADPEATVYTDDATAYESLPFDHDSVKHSLGEYVKGDAHTNGIESLWSMLKRAHKGTFHKLSAKHLDRYIQEFAGRHNVRQQDTDEQMASMRGGMEGKRLTYKALIRGNGLSSGARAA